MIVYNISSLFKISHVRHPFLTSVSANTKSLFYLFYLLTVEIGEQYLSNSCNYSTIRAYSICPGSATNRPGIPTCLEIQYIVALDCSKVLLMNYINLVFS